MKLRSFAFAFLAVLCMSVAWAQLPDIPSFSADMKTTGQHGEDASGRIFFANRHLRMQMNMRGQNTVVIVDSTNPQNPTSTILMPDQHMYMQMSAASVGGMRQRAPHVRVYDPDNPCSGMEGTTCKKVAVETVNGYASDKWEFTGKSTQTVWIAQKIHFPVRSVESNGMTVDFTNIHEGPQDPALFTVPDGYRKFDMSGMMGQHPSQDQ